MLGYYGKRSHATADLKRQAHEVRQRVNAMPRKDRERRMFSRITKRAEDGTPIAVAYDVPRLVPRERHRFAWSARR